MFQKVYSILKLPHPEGIIFWDENHYLVDDSDDDFVDDSDDDDFSDDSDDDFGDDSNGIKPRPEDIIFRDNDGYVRDGKGNIVYKPDEDPFPRIQRNWCKYDRSKFGTAKEINAPSDDFDALYGNIYEYRNFKDFMYQEGIRNNQLMTEEIYAKTLGVLYEKLSDIQKLAMEHANIHIQNYLNQVHNL